MKLLLNIALIGSLFLCFSCAKPTPTIVGVDGGLVQGEIIDSMMVFKGIPFAAPPVGELRWKAPQPVEKWDGIKQTTQYAPAPMQAGNPSSGKSEDCLYLNIWTPTTSPKEKLPVMVWIYGGGFSFGSTCDGVTDGTNLAKKGVILVSIAYRVGQLAFFAHPELSKESPEGVSGNYGLLDQIAALKWVQKNIEAFGGDPEKVTIFGESAGAISVSMLCASPLAKGLFRGAISQSGGSFGPTRSTTYPGENMKTLKQAENDGIEYMKQHNASSIAELRQMDAEQFVPKGWTMPGGWPIVDGYVIPDDQHKLYEAGKYNDVPVLIGYNSDEGASFSHEKTPEDYYSAVNARYGKFADQLIEAYPATSDRVPKTARDLMRDAAFGWQTWSWANLQSQTGKSDVYYYYFDQHPDYPQDSPYSDMGSPHGQDVAYVFMHVNPNNKSDVVLSEIMGDYWTNFVKYGNPNGENLPHWSSYNSSSHKVMCLKEKPCLIDVPSEQSMQVLDDYFEWRRTPEGTAWGNE